MHFFAVIFLALLLIVSALAVYGVFFSLWLPSLFILRVRRKWRATFIAIPLVGVAYVLALGGLWLWATSPVSVFESTFHMPPPPDVRHLQSDLWYFADSGEVYLQFECDPATAPTLTAAVGLNPQPPPHSSPWSGGPAWWSPPPVSAWNGHYYFADLTGRDFTTHEEAALIYNPTTGQVNYHWYGLD